MRGRLGGGGGKGLRDAVESQAGPETPDMTENRGRNRRAETERESD